MGIGWFDAFRDRGAPTWYGDNRTPVVADPPTLAVCAVFGILLAALLPAVFALRRRKLDSMLSVSLVMCVGAAILVPLLHPDWHVAEADIVAPYRAFVPVKLHAKLGIRIGLANVNVTLTTQGNASISGLDYNERFNLDDVSSMKRELADALQQGMPYPMLTAIEYLSVDRAGFAWGRHYRAAGYYTSVLLWHSFALWLLAATCLCMCAEYFSRMSMCLGASLIVSDVVYAYSVPWDKPLVIRFPPIEPAGAPPMLRFSLGWCFWLVMAAGALCLVYGGVLRLCEYRADYRHTTCMEPGFDRGHRPSKLKADKATVARSVSQHRLSMHRIRPMSPLRIDAAAWGAERHDSDEANLNLVRHDCAYVERRRSLRCPDAINLTATQPTALTHWRLGNASAVSPKHAPPYGVEPPPSTDFALSAEPPDAQHHGGGGEGGESPADRESTGQTEPAGQPSQSGGGGGEHARCVTTIAVGSPPLPRRARRQQQQQRVHNEASSGGGASASRSSHCSSSSAWRAPPSSSSASATAHSHSSARPLNTDRF